jgi:parallel beta-helix repeat protein
MLRILRLRSVVTLCCLAHLGVTAGAAEIYVAPTGDDSNAGTKAAPLKTLTGARDAVRKCKAGNSAAGGVTVWLGGGVYPLSSSLELDQRDSGTASAPIIYRAAAGADVRLRGGIELDRSAFGPVTDPAVTKRLSAPARAKVLKADLKSSGITDPGTMRARGFPYPVEPLAAELFFNDQRMQLARWPNQGFAQYGAVIDKGSIPRNRDKLLPKEEQNFEPPRAPTFVYTDDRPSRWIGAEDVWLFGYWTYPWAEETLGVQKIDPAKHAITLATPAHYGVSPNKQFYALNVLEELDSPGEYYIDRGSGVLYFWPPSDLAPGSIVVSSLERPLIVMKGASHITIRDCVLEDSRGCGIYMTGGSGNRIDHCMVRNVGTVGIMIGEGADGENIGDVAWSYLSRLYREPAWNRNAGTDQGVLGCIIHDTGADGIILGGGDRKTLTPGRNFATGNEIYRVGRWYEQNHPAVGVDGVGNRVSNNFMHDMPHAAVMFRGNDHVMEKNELLRCVTRSEDAGVFYTGRDVSGRGNIIRDNYVHDCGPATSRPGGIGTFAVYFDDTTSGQSVSGNIFCRAAGAGVVGATIELNGGYDNLIENNFYIDSPSKIGGAPMPAPQWNAYVRSEIQMQRLRQAVDITAPPYSTRYPRLKSVYDDSPDVKRENVVRGDHVIADPHVADSLDRQPLREAAPELKAQLKAAGIPFEQIGLLEKAGPAAGGDARAAGKAPSTAEGDVPQFQSPAMTHVTVENSKAGQYLSICPNLCELADGSFLIAYHRTTRVDFSGAYSTWTRMSHDGGKSWSEPRLFQEHLQAPGLLRLRSGDVLLNGCTVINDRWSTTMRLFRSGDSGQSWTEQKPIWENSQGIRLQGGCASLVQLKSGRILCPMFETNVTSADYGAATEGLVAGCYFSDDDGKSWRQAKGTISLPKRGAMEPSVAQLSDGTLVMTLRTQLGFVYVSQSKDDGQTWSKPWSSGLEAPEAPLVMTNFPDGRRLLLVYCSGKFVASHHHSGERTPLTAAVSDDKGKSWRKLGDIVGGPHEFGATSICFTSADRVLIAYDWSRIPWDRTVKTGGVRIAIADPQWFDAPAAKP